MIIIIDFIRKNVKNNFGYGINKKDKLTVNK